MKSQTLLFGGTLLIAGMSAQAQSFTFSASSDAHAFGSYAYSYGYFSYGHFLSGDDNPFNTNDFSSYTNTALNTTQSYTAMGVGAEFFGGGAYGVGLGSAVMSQHFTVDVDSQLDFAWDMAGSNNRWVIELYQADGGSSTELLRIRGQEGAPSVSTDSYNLTAGTEYYLYMTISQFSGPGSGSIFLNDIKEYSLQANLVPSPSVFAPIGIAGLLACRRHRR